MNLRCSWRAAILAAVASVPSLPLAAQTPEVWPPGRAGHAAAYDAARGEVVIVGGDTDLRSQTRDSLWAWSGTAWRVSPAEGPGWRTLPALAFDSKRRRVVLQGGRRKFAPMQYADTAESDTWAWDGAAWHRLATEGPGQLDHHAMAYDAAHDMMVIQGGANGGSILSGETWGFDGTAWRKLADSSAGPGPRVHHAMAYDSRRGRVVMFGGFGPGGGRGEAREGETWEWDGARWDRVATTGPGPRSRHRLAYDSTAGLVILFGGSDDRRTWGWDGRTWRVVAEDGPPPRGMHAMAADTRRQRVVLYGGGDTSLHDLWEFDGTRWVRVAASPR